MPVVAEKLTKSFAGVRVLDAVDLAVDRGEVHALLGANGSGKSTLVRILTGVYQPDAGSIRVGGRTFAGIASPHEANDLGIAVVHQEAPLVDTLTVAECIGLFRGYPTRAGRVLWRRLNGDCADLLERFGIAVSPRQLAGDLNPSQRALVALAIALDRVKSGLELLILDEVTASLPEDDAAIYLERVAAIARGGIGVLMVTHRLAELNGLAATVTVLRDGRRVYHAPVGDTDEEGLVGHMVGPVSVDRPAAAKATAGASRKGAVRALWSAGATPDAPRAAAGAEALRVENLSGRTIRDISFRVGAGEIVGVAGLADSGVAELPQLLAGIARRRGGAIRIAGGDLPEAAGPGEAIDLGLALLPADRLRNGGVATLSVGENVILPNVDRFWHRRRQRGEVLATTISVLDVRPPRPEAIFGRLSGGNQQKALIGKWLLTRPKLFVLDDPTSGVDPGAREKIFEIVHDAAAEGVGILFFSTEPEQLAAMCSRLIVLKNGQIATELTGADLTREMISQWCYT